MFKKMIVTSVLVIAGISAAQALTAQTTPAPVVSAPIGADTGAVNPHQSRDSIFRACKLDADNKKLVGTARNVAIATCVKTTVR